MMAKLVKGLEFCAISDGNASKDIKFQANSLKHYISNDTLLVTREVSLFLDEKKCGWICAS